MLLGPVAEQVLTSLMAKGNQVLTYGALTQLSRVFGLSKGVVSHLFCALLWLDLSLDDNSI